MGLETETVINMTTAARVRRVLSPKVQDPGGTDADIQGLIRTLSRDAMVRLMKRAVYKKARTERFDVDSNQREFWVLGSPIDTSVALVVYNNVERPRIFTQSADLISTDYIIVNPDRAEAGRVLFDTSLKEGMDTLQIAYTGGMASQTCLTGTDGATAASGVFNSASGNFIVDGVVAGHELIITEYGTTNTKVYTVTTTPTVKTQLSVSPDFTNESETGASFELSTGFVADYPDISWAVTQQAAYMWQRKLQFGMESESIPGMSVKWTTPVSWRNFALDILREGHGRRF